MQDGLAEVDAAGTNRDRARSQTRPAIAELGAFELSQALREISENLGGNLAAAAPGAQNARQGQNRGGFAGHYSRISSVKRFLSFIPAAPRMVRIDFAVRPCRPITLPRSSGCTRNSRTVTCSPSTART